MSASAPREEPPADARAAVARLASPAAVSARAATRRRKLARPTRVTGADHTILAFAAEHRFVLVPHVQALLGVTRETASRRLAGLAQKGLMSKSRPFEDQGNWYRIARPGLELIGSDLPPPRGDIQAHRHDIGMAWVWLAASRGAFGRAERVVSEREMRSSDGRVGGRVGAEPRDMFGVPVLGVGPRGRPGLHYPDLLLTGAAGERIAVELELTGKGNRRLEKILTAYGADPRISAVLYLVDNAAIGRRVQSAAARLGMSGLVHVRAVEWQAGTAAGAGIDRAAGRVENARAAARVEDPRAAGRVEDPRAAGRVETARAAGRVENPRAAGRVETAPAAGRVENARAAGAGGHDRAAARKWPAKSGGPAATGQLPELGTGTSRVRATSRDMGIER